jgi:nicotinate-nucleotide--dimethylbenzimidazole phosphoribosyltransferase
MSFNSLDEFAATAKNLSQQNTETRDRAAQRNGMLTKPAGSLGKLEDIAIWAAAWQAQNPPTFAAPQVAIFAGNHGVCAQGISAFPSEVTVQMVANFEQGGAAINQLAKAFGAKFSVHALELDKPTQDFTQSPAMTENECVTALNTGWGAVDPASDFLVVGEMGIGNTTVAAALCAALFGGAGSKWAGPGTGVDKKGVATKADVIDTALKLHKDTLTSPLEILRILGGRELAAMVGAIAAARQHNIPVILDGFVVCAAAAIFNAMSDTALDHCIAGHCSAEPGHILMLKELNKDPLLQLGMRLGEGSGAALALGIVKGAVATHAGMASFEEAGVSGQEE